MCVCVCVLASRWAYIGTAGPFMGRSNCPWSYQPYRHFPPLGSITTPPYVLTGLLPRLFPYPLMAPSSWGYLFRVGGTQPTDKTGISLALESAYATGQNLSGMRWRAYLSDFLIPITVELMTPVVRTWRLTPHTMCADTNDQSS